MKLFLLFNKAAQYRKNIYSQIEERWDCEWVFGVTDKGSPSFDPTIFHNSRLSKYIRLKLEPWYRLDGAYLAAKQSGADVLITIGDMYNLSVWHIALVNRLLWHKRLIMWSHGWYGRENFARKWLKRIFFGLADHVLTYGDYAARVAQQQGFPARKLTPIHNSLAYEKQQELIGTQTLNRSIYRDHFHNENQTLVFIGRLKARKKVSMLADALNLLKERGERYNCVIVGDGEDRDIMHETFSNYGLNDTTWFYGPCYDESTNYQLIANADLCVSPGDIGLMAIHAMTYGTPVISHDDFTHQGPESETIIPGKTGNFFKHDDVESLADCISDWFKNHASAETPQICKDEIAKAWTPQYQLDILQQVLNK
jgi:glycosyltransferase involved in cell wall biosynthesis